MGGDARRGLLGSGMKIAKFGLTVSSSLGNGHATVWRGLIRALTRRGHRVVFFERDVPYYANVRDVLALPAPSQLLLYSDWASVRSRATEVLRDADLAIVTSYCPDAQSATDAVLDAPRPRKAFYDLDSEMPCFEPRRSFNPKTMCWCACRIRSGSQRTAWPSSPTTTCRSYSSPWPILRHSTSSSPTTTTPSGKFRSSRRILRAIGSGAHSKALATCSTSCTTRGRRAGAGTSSWERWSTHTLLGVEEPSAFEAARRTSTWAP